MLLQDIPFSMILFELLLQCWASWAARRWLPWSGSSVLSCAVVCLCTQSLLLSFSLDRSCELDSIWHCMESHKYSYRFMFGQLFLAFKKFFQHLFWPTEQAENAHRKRSSAVVRSFYRHWLDRAVPNYRRLAFLLGQYPSNSSDDDVSDDLSL